MNRSTFAPATTFSIALSIVPVVGAVLLACSTTATTESNEEQTRVATVLPLPSNAIDVLFVIDDSGSMHESQEQLGVWASEMFRVFDLIDGQSPDLHLGVISSSVEIGGFGVITCSGTGDGRFHQTGSNGQRCGNLEDSFIRDYGSPSGTRVRNFEGELDDVFSCIAKVGDGGCGFEQPYAAVRRALDGSHPSNDGFLRDNALLLVVIVSDEDDCSAKDTSLFGYDTDTVGPLNSYRCFAHGVVCDDDQPFELGARTSCESREDSALVTSVAEMRNFLVGLKPDPSQLMVAAIVAPESGVNVIRSDFGDSKLENVCASNVDAAPAVRHHQLLTSLPSRSVASDICSPDLSWAMQRTAQLATNVANQSPCLSAMPVDLDPSASGLQTACHARWLVPGQSDAPLVSCKGSGSTSCFEIVADETCADSGMAVALRGARKGTLALECAL